MKRALLLAAAGIAAIAVVLPATAGAASFTGVVIAKKQARHAVVTASKNGVVRTTRVRGSRPALSFSHPLSSSARRLRVKVVRSMSTRAARSDTLRGAAAAVTITEYWVVLMPCAARCAS